MKKGMRLSQSFHLLPMLLMINLILASCSQTGQTNGGANLSIQLSIDSATLVHLAIDMQMQLYGKADTYATNAPDLAMQQAITYWAYNVCGLQGQNVPWQTIVATISTCALVNPGNLQCNTGGACVVITEGNLQCVEFVTGVFGAQGEPLPISGNGNQFWGNYQGEAGWSEVSPNDVLSGSNAPQPGDIVGFTNSNPNGHVAIVVAVQAPQGGNDGYIILAGGNQVGNVTAADLAMLGATRGDFYKLTWHSQTYLSQHNGAQLFEGYTGDVVQGFIRRINYSQPLMVNTQNSQKDYFAPYTMDNNLVPEVQATGASSLNLAFTSAQNNSCQPNLDPQLASSIKDLQAAGKKAIVSFGGGGDMELAQACGTVLALENAYQSVITTYGVSDLDFDIEGAAASETTSIDLRNQALADLQAKNPSLQVTYTLSVDTAGLPNNDLDILRSALTHGVRVNIVNIMTMDYYDAASAPGNQMGQNAIKAATATETQLQQLYPNQTTAQLWAMIGITPDLGINDNPNEIFTLDDAKQVLAFAQQQQIGELSFWVVSRDHPCTGGASYQRSQCSGIDQTDYAFSQIFSAFN